MLYIFLNYEGGAFEQLDNQGLQLKILPYPEMILYVWDFGAVRELDIIFSTPAKENQSMASSRTVSFRDFGLSESLRPRSW